MKGPILLARLSWIAVLLWCATGAVLCLATVDPTAVIPVVDAVAGKDVTWMALATAISAIGFSAWLVRQMLKQNADTAKAINELRAELAERPCVFHQNQPQIHQHR